MHSVGADDEMSVIIMSIGRLDANLIVEMGNLDDRLVGQDAVFVLKTTMEHGQGVLAIEQSDGVAKALLEGDGIVAGIAVVVKILGMGDI